MNSSVQRQISTYLVKTLQLWKMFNSNGDVSSNIPHNMIKFAETTDTIIDLETSKKLNSLWAITAIVHVHSYSNSITIQQVSIYSCLAFCARTLTVLYFLRYFRNTGGTKWDPITSFFQCVAVEHLSNQIFSWQLESPVENSRQELFTVFNRADFRKIDFLTIFSKLLLKYYWDCKQRQCLPNLQNAKTVFKSELNIIIHCNLKIHMIYENSGINFNFSYLPLLMLGIGVATMYINLHIMVSLSIFYPVQDSIAVSEPGRGRSLRHGPIPRARVSFETSFHRNNPNWNWNRN